MIIAGSKKDSHRCLPILYGAIVDLYNDMFNDRRPDPLVRQGEINVRRVAAIEFEDWPYRRPHLLPLHVGSITGNKQSADSDECRNQCAVSAYTVCRLFFRHEGILSRCRSGKQESSRVADVESLNRRSSPVLCHWQCVSELTDRRYRFSLVTVHISLTPFGIVFVQS